MLWAFRVRVESRLRFSELVRKLGGVQLGLLIVLTQLVLQSYLRGSR